MNPFLHFIKSLPFELFLRHPDGLHSTVFTDYGAVSSMIVITVRKSPRSISEHDGFGQGTPSQRNISTFLPHSLHFSIPHYALASCIISTHRVPPGVA